ncbi:MAG: DNA repair protein RecO [bacterium]
MSIHRTHGVVLRSRKVRESSKIVLFFTRDFGKISVVGKGSLRPKSKFGASLELFTRCAIMFYSKQNRNLHTLSHAEILSSYENLKKDVVKFAYGGVVAELVEKFCPNEEQNRAIYELLVKTLSEIDVAQRDQIEIILSIYELKFLELIGYAPQLDVCVRCGHPVEEKLWFGLTSGGLLCEECHKRDLNALRIGSPALLLLKAYRSGSIEELAKKIRPDRSTREAADLLHSFLRMQAGDGVTIKSLDFLERMRNDSICR